MNIRILLNSYKNIKLKVFFKSYIIINVFYYCFYNTFSLFKVFREHFYPSNIWDFLLCITHIRIWYGQQIIKTSNYINFVFIYNYPYALLNAYIHIIKPVKLLIFFYVFYTHLYNKTRKVLHKITNLNKHFYIAIKSIFIDFIYFSVILLYFLGFLYLCIVFFIIIWYGFTKKKKMSSYTQNHI